MIYIDESDHAFMVLGDNLIPMNHPDFMNAIQEEVDQEYLKSLAINILKRDYNYTDEYLNPMTYDEIRLLVSSHIFGRKNECID